MSRRRMHNYAGRLVDDQQIRVLINDIQGRLAGPDASLPAFRRGFQCPYFVAAAKHMTRLAWPSIDKNLAINHQLLDGGAREVLQHAYQVTIQPLTCLLRLDLPGMLTIC